MWSLRPPRLTAGLWTRRTTSKSRSTALLLGAHLQPLHMPEPGEGVKTQACWPSLHVTLGDKAQGRGRSLLIRKWDFFISGKRDDTRRRSTVAPAVSHPATAFLPCPTELSCSVTSSSLHTPGLQPTRLLRPWDSSGKSTGVGCHCLHS